MASVKVEQGLLRGGKSKTDNGFEYYEFLEIPYAKPPVGELRFLSPQEPETWEGERDATIANKYCAQYNMLDRSVYGTEDCLYLNVYTPKLPINNNELLPVMVYIHGGGFAYGKGTIKDESGPDYLLEQNVIIVSINYRINIFGFLSLDIPEASGNMGLKDQVKALQWVKNNIAQFGGDNNNVTLFGISAGSSSIEYLILSPKAKGHFQKAILESGSTLNPWAIYHKSKEIAFKLAQTIGFKGVKNDYRGIHSFLMKQTTEVLLKPYTDTVNSIDENRIHFGFVPCIEKDFDDNEDFLTENPYDLLKKGKFNRVKVIRGFCDTEGVLPLFMKPEAIKKIVNAKTFTQYLSHKIIDSSSYNEKFKSIYLNNVNHSSEEDRFAIDFCGDVDFVSGIWIAGKFMAKYGLPVYMYKFSFNGECSLLKNIFGISIKGCSHGDDSAYVIKMQNIIPKSHSDMIVRDRFAVMWTNFAKSGKPTIETSELIPIEWPLFKEGEMKYLEINENLSLQSNYEPTKMAIFSELYDKYKI